MRFDLSGHVQLRLGGADAALEAALRREMSPYAPLSDDAAASGAVTVELEPLIGDMPPLSELQLAAGDGFVTGSLDGRLYLLAGGRRISIPDAVEDEPARVAYEPGVSLAPLFRYVVRPSLQLRALAAGGVAMHASAVVRDGKATLVAGWSESGKTETALALVEDGAQFLSDKWTLLGPSESDIADGCTAAPFPINVGIRRWALRYLPRLRAAIPRRARLRFAAAGTFGIASGPVRALGRRGRAGRLVGGAERALALADRVGLSPTEIAEAYGHEAGTQRVPVDLVILLRTIPAGEEVRVSEADRSLAAQRLAASAVTERQGYFALRQRAAYAVGTAPSIHDIADREEERIRDLLASAPVVEVASPFPTDPRRVVAALEPWLRR